MTIEELKKQAQSIDLEEAKRLHAEMFGVRTTEVRETQVTVLHNILFRYWLPALSEAETKALLYICYKTVGYNKEEDAIDWKQMLHGVVTKQTKERLDWGCGIISRETLKEALLVLEVLGLIIVKRPERKGRGATNRYRIREVGAVDELTQEEQNLFSVRNPFEWVTAVRLMVKKNTRKVR